MKFFLTKEEKEEIYKLYNHKDLPKIKNIFFYNYACFAKIFFYVFFGVGSVFLALFVFPWIRLFHHSKLQYQIAARKFVSASFRMFLNFMRLMGVTKVKVDDLEAYKNIHSKIIIANHPSILDFVYIMSMVPNANCIVRGGLAKTVLGGVIRQCYIVNTLGFDELCQLCEETLKEGNNVIIFPEGTRTPRHGYNHYKKGAARIAYNAKCDVQPILIGGNDKYGLGKHDPFWSYNHTEKYVYDFKLLPVISIQEYLDCTETIAAKRLTEKMEKQLFEAVSENDKYYVTNRDTSVADLF